MRGGDFGGVGLRRNVLRKQTTIGGLFSFVPYFYDDEPRLFFLRYP